MKRCHACNAEIDLDKISFREECFSCGSDLHVCLNCTFHDIGRHNACREDRADYVKEKDRANYCEYFVFSDKSAAPMDTGKDKAKKLWDELFNKS